ncbi:MAG: FkbM family methyltransferase [Candidatus Sumerlaeaceae bacterium]|nr:FkbM family methyltransferase [Candidatus Sumerlaeaceae bacterium]
MLKNTAKAIVNSGLRPFGLQIRKWRRPSHDRYEQCLRLAMGHVARPFAIDIGAHEGQSSAGILELFPQARILAFEPAPKTFQALQKCASAKGFEAFNLALADREGEMEFNCFDSSQCNSLLAPVSTVNSVIAGLRQEPVKELVKISTLDGLLNARGLSQTPVDYLKVDVQGFEMPVLRGAAKTLQSTRNILIEVSFCKAYQGQCLVDEVCHFLREAGFVLGMTIGYLPADDFDELVSSDFFFTRKD